MKQRTLNVVGVILIASLTATIAQSKFSGIYSGNVSSKEKFLIAITKGGRALGLSSDSEGFSDALDPSKSTINSAGKLQAVMGDGRTTINATVSSDFTMKGTVKSRSETLRIAGKRTLN